MSKKSVILSSAGIKNLVLKDQTDNFTFKIGSREFKMHKVYADFLSPRVSHLHHCDPTIDELKFEDYFTKESKILNTKLDEFISEEIIYRLQEISSGYSIDIDEHEAPLFRFLCILLCNDELLSIIDDFFPIEFEKMKPEDLIKEIQIFYILQNENYSHIYR